MVAIVAVDGLSGSDNAQNEPLDVVQPTNSAKANTRSILAVTWTISVVPRAPDQPEALQCHSGPGP